MVGDQICSQKISEIAAKYHGSTANSSTITSLFMLAAGFLSQGPLILLLLMATGVVSYQKVAHYRFHIIILIFLPI